MWFCIIVCLLCFGMGLMFSWPSSTLVFNDSYKGNLHRKISDTEIILFTCLPILGALIAVPIGGICLDKYGRKSCAVASCVLCTLSWALVACSNRVEVALAAVLTSGLSGAMFVIAPVYISEVCRDNIRGIITSSCAVLYEIGMLVSYILGSYLDFYEMVYLSLSMSAVGTICVCTLTESPVYLIGKGMEEEAAKSIAFYRGTVPKSSEVSKEVALIQRAFDTGVQIADYDVDEKTLEKYEKPFGNVVKTLKFIRQSRPTQQALVVAMILVSASLFQGMLGVESYAEQIFEEAVPSITGPVCYVLLDIVTLFFGLVALYLAEVAGRRPLMIYSSFATGINCIVLGTQIHKEWAPSWFTCVMMFVFSVIYTIGPGTVPYIVFQEIFLPEVKSFIMMLVVEWVLLCCFIYFVIFIPFVEMHVAITICAIFYVSIFVCFGTALLCLVYMPETKGLPTHMIPTFFSGANGFCPKNQFILRNQEK